MCEMASFFHLPATGEIKVWDLMGHGETEKELKLDLKIWREGHYEPNGKIELRFTDTNRVDRVEYETAFRNRFPTFISFLNWGFSEIGEKYSGWLDLSGLTSADGLKLPSSISGWLDLRALTSADGLTLPSSINGSLYLSDSVRAELEMRG